MSKLHFNFVTAFPEFFEGALGHGLVGKAIENSTLSYKTINPRDHAPDRHQSIDDAPYGGGDGMVLSAPVFQKTLQSMPKPEKGRVLVMTPQGRKLTNDFAKELAGESALTLLCGRYSGFDQRLITVENCEEVSIGDYVLNGGEVASMVVVEAVSRFVPGVLGNKVSAEIDSFADGLLEGPVFTRPEYFAELQVPHTLTSGDHAKIKSFRKELSLIVTYLRRPDLIQQSQMSEVLKASQSLQKLEVGELLACGFSKDHLVKVEHELTQRLNS